GGDASRRRPAKAVEVCRMAVKMEFSTHATQILPPPRRRRRGAQRTRIAALASRGAAARKSPAGFRRPLEVRARAGNRAGKNRSAAGGRAFFLLRRLGR